MNRNRKIPPVAIPATLRIMFVWILVCCLSIGGVEAQEQSDWCGTQRVYDQKIKSGEISALAPGGICPQQGACDNPAMRNQYLSGARIKVVRLYFQVLCDDSGANCAASAADVAVQVDSLNSDFAGLGFRFVYHMRFVNSSRFRYLTSFADAELMKSTHAVAPNRQINIYVTQNGFCTCSYATYPWDPAALTSTGGVVMTRERFFPQSQAASTLTHEIGHALGLWHSHHGVSEVPPCSDCYESVNAENRDSTGDFCADTRPTPSNTTCVSPAGNDNCSGSPWGETDIHNYMGYAPDPCLTEFSPEQIARMHCWTESTIGGAMQFSMSCDTLFGAAPFPVHVGATYGGTVSAWNWDFGDSTHSMLQNPAHTFATGGQFNPKCLADTGAGQFTIEGLPSVYVTSETLVVAKKVADTNTSVRVDITVDNRVPLTEAVIPLTWAGPLGLAFDSLSTAGLRTSNLNTADGSLSVLSKQFNFQRMTIALRPDSLAPIAIGSGPLISLYLHTPGQVIAGENPIQISAYDTFVPRLRTIPGDYPPRIVNGSISLTCCVGETGNIDGDPAENIDIADVGTLIDHLFISLRPLPCAAEANVDGDPAGTVDIADLSRLIDFLYIGFTPPASCR